MSNCSRNIIRNYFCRAFWCYFYVLYFRNIYDVSVSIFDSVPVRKIYRNFLAFSI
ncbi:hypothetical protein AGR7A_Cc140093 [Agrobacterium deltaense NCPPB 1641]|uniref:Uncharacterized protein n=1 Tax=Agrobacterium deltaense NCPPB 1641 TaxID=1183425 RepID=A0A1S7TK67_9HYPH|nr:hypothetical protein AGR7A_Cc140093 [Agrobacterium deltaense NCPPB 1641]